MCSNEHSTLVGNKIVDHADVAGAKVLEFRSPYTRGLTGKYFTQDELFYRTLQPVPGH